MMTLHHQCLDIPPDHPIAQDFYDVVGLQFVLIDQRNAAHWAGDVDRVKLVDEALELVGDAITGMQNEIRRERGGDETYTVGMTHAGNGYPVVNGRPGGPPITLN